MIDTIKIYAEIDRETHDKIKSLSIVKSSIDNSINQLQYEIINDHLEGSYSSNLSVRVGCGSKYHFANLGYFVEIEGSYHKLVKGYNSHNGFYDIVAISNNLITRVSLSYDIELPDVEEWYLNRCDIAICYDLETQDNVKSYINSLSRCNYPRRTPKFYYDESIYLSGTTTTLKIYNKLLEFKKHDMKKFVNTDFDLFSYQKAITGFIRFECEIKKKMLQKVYNAINIKLIDVNYDVLKGVWSDEFMRIIKLIQNDLEIVRGREQVYDRLNKFYKPSKANRLYNFYCVIQLNGENVVKENYASSTFYRNIDDLKSARVDFSQSYKVEEEEIFYFNPFEYQEVV